ncbi:MAG: ADP-ribosylglycohydrolase family protein, partial [Planctomycetaceae bacterium]|nr:ADP-ribosylglycohydrolase family protein [Planctomycetaceae bacterium]
MAMDESQRARLALEGLSVGDAYGQRFFFPGAVEQADRNTPPPPPWYYTDDTEMAMAIVEVLEHHNAINQDALARKFAERFSNNPGRGYGGGAFKLLKAIDQGADWRQESQAMFGGQGSLGNGGAMRAAPLGAWFAEDVERTIEQARLSAEVTHAHPEGQAGAVAIALAAGWA